MTKKPTLVVANSIIKRADFLFRCAAKAYERGNNSGDSEYMEKQYALCDKLRGKAEALLTPYGIEVDYPGLCPSFKVRGYDHYTTESAMSAALEPKPRKK